MEMRPSRYCMNVLSVLDDLGVDVLILCIQFELLLSQHVAVATHGAKVASVHGQQHHGPGEDAVTHISQTLGAQHGELAKMKRNRSSSEDLLYLRMFNSRWVRTGPGRFWHETRLD